MKNPGHAVLVDDVRNAMVVQEKQPGLVVSRKEPHLSAKMVVFSESRPMRDEAIVCWRVKPVGEPCAGNRHTQFEYHRMEITHGMRLLRHKRGNPDTELCRNLNHRATSRLYPYFEQTSERWESLRHWGVGWCRKAVVPRLLGGVGNRRVFGVACSRAAVTKCREDRQKLDSARA